MILYDTACLYAYWYMILHGMADSQVDKYESNRVWATTRLTGTHNGPLVFDNKVRCGMYQ